MQQSLITSGTKYRAEATLAIRLKAARTSSSLTSDVLSDLFRKLFAPKIEIIQSTD